MIASRLSIEVGKTYLRNVHGIIYSTRLCVPAQRDRGRTEWSTVFQGRGGSALARANERASEHGLGTVLEPAMGVAAVATFFRRTSTNEYIRVIFFYSLPTSDIYIYGYISAQRSVCFMAYTRRTAKGVKGTVRGGDGDAARAPLAEEPCYLLDPLDCYWVEILVSRFCLCFSGFL